MTGASPLDGSASAKIAIDEGKDGQVPDFKADVAVDGQQKGAAFKLNAGGTYTGGRFYVNYDGEDYDVGEELSKRAVSSMQQAIKQSGGNGDQQQLVGQLGLNPETWLTDPKVDGDEKIGDTDTYRITGAVDVKQLVPDILDAARKAQSLTGAGATGQKVPTVTDAQLEKVTKDIEKLDVTIWTGKDDKILRQLKVDMKLKSGKDSLDGSIQLTLTGVNEPQDISAPSDTKPITDLMPKLGGLFNAASGLSSATGASSTGTTPAVSDEYVQCVNAAGNDPAKLNACQAALTK